MAQLLPESAQLVSPRKTRAVPLRGLRFVVPQPRANEIKTLENEYKGAFDRD